MSYLVSEAPQVDHLAAIVQNRESVPYVSRGELERLYAIEREARALCAAVTPPDNPDPPLDLRRVLVEGNVLLPLFCTLAYNSSG
jgi:hypothetical protein